MTEVALDEDAPAAGKLLNDLGLPGKSFVAAVIRDGEVVPPRGEVLLRVADRLLLIALPENQEEILRILSGQEA